MESEAHSKVPYLFKLVSGQFNIEAPSYLSPDKKIAILVKLENTNAVISDNHYKWNVELDFPYHFRYG